VRTGGEADLSAPIDFSRLEKHALPPDIPSITSAIRILLCIAVSYLYSLQKQEETARPELYTHLTRHIDRRKNPNIWPLDAQAPRFYPRGEDEWVCEMYREDVYHKAGIESYNMKCAMNRVHRRATEDAKWDDLVDYGKWCRKCQ
jgi:hypothetical protein